MNITNENNKPIIKNENKNSKNEISKDNEIERLKRELKEEKEKNKNLENIINELRTKNKNDTQKLKNEIKSYVEKIEKLSMENNNLKDKMKGQGVQNNTDEIVRLYKKIEGLNEKIDDLNAKLKRFPFVLEEGEKIMSIIFTSVDQKLNYSMICKNTDTINNLEGRLYKEYQKLAKANYYFICNGTVLNKFEKLDRYPFILEKDEKIMSVIFTSVNQNLNYSMICKNTDTINKLEAQLYKEYPKLGEANYYFICNGTVLKKFEKLEKLKIKSGDIILLNEVED